MLPCLLARPANRRRRVTKWGAQRDAINAIIKRETIITLSDAARYKCQPLWPKMMIVPEHTSVDGFDNFANEQLMALC